MESKVVAVLLLLCLAQGISSKAVGGPGSFWAGNPFLAANPFFASNPLFNPLAPTIDPEILPIIRETQMRLSQLRLVAKSSIGMTVGLASKKIGIATSQAKTTVKTLINGVKNNPTATKECSELSKPIVEQLKTESNTQLAYCSKFAQIQLKSQNQVQSEITLQIDGLTQELNIAVSECTLENLVPSETSNVTTCVTDRVEDIKVRLSSLEQTIQETVQDVQTNVAQIGNDAKTCSQQVQQSVQEQTNSIRGEQVKCSATATVTPLLV